MTENLIHRVAISGACVWILGWGYHPRTISRCCAIRIPQHRLLLDLRAPPSKRTVRLDCYGSSSWRERESAQALSKTNYYSNKVVCLGFQYHHQPNTLGIVIMPGSERTHTQRWWWSYRAGERLIQINKRHAQSVNLTCSIHATSRGDQCTEENNPHPSRHMICLMNDQRMHRSPRSYGSLQCQSVIRTYIHNSGDRDDQDAGTLPPGTENGQDFHSHLFQTLSTFGRTPSTPEQWAVPALLAAFNNKKHWA